MPNEPAFLVAGKNNRQAKSISPKPATIFILSGKGKYGGIRTKYDNGCTK